jgi:phospholipase C
VKRLAACAIAGVLAGCSPGAGGRIALPATPAARPYVLPVGNYIKHVVIVVQENRSFDNIFTDFPGADSHPNPKRHDGTTVALHGIDFLGSDIYHGWAQAILNWNGGRMNQFDLNYLTNGQPAGNFPYARLRRSIVAPYWKMASQYVLADRMFPTEFGPSFTAHLDSIAGTSNLTPRLALTDGPSEGPWGCDAPAGTVTSVVNAHRAVTHNVGPFPCFAQFRTMADTLDAAHVSWKFYSPSVLNAGSTFRFWTPFASIKNVRYGPDWTRNVVSPQTKILLDPAKGKLPSVSWVTPDGPDSDHAGWQSNSGPSWVASVVNAIGESPYWNSTAIVIVWDEWGGWYDHVPPPQLDFRGLGIRVPLLIVSPYAKAHYVSHTQYEYGSILKFVEQAFDLPPLGPTSLGYTDTRANSLADSFDFTQRPRAFKPIPDLYRPSYFLNRPPSHAPADDQ